VALESLPPAPEEVFCAFEGSAFSGSEEAPFDEVDEVVGDEVARSPFPESSSEAPELLASLESEEFEGADFLFAEPLPPTTGSAIAEPSSSPALAVQLAAREPRRRNTATKRDVRFTSTLSGELRSTLPLPHLFSGNPGPGLLL
jgi:hypothetical protein